VFIAVVVPLVTVVDRVAQRCRTVVRDLLRQCAWELARKLPKLSAHYRYRHRPCPILPPFVVVHDDDRDGLGAVRGHEQSQHQATAQADRLCLSTPNTTRSRPCQSLAFRSLRIDIDFLIIISPLSHNPPTQDIHAHVDDPLRRYETRTHRRAKMGQIKRTTTTTSPGDSARNLQRLP